MRQYNSLLLTLILLVSTTLALRELEYRDTVAKAPTTITVYVCGEVLHPGVVSLPSNARRIHAIDLCGGLTSQADSTNLSPAEVLRDGETVEVAARETRTIPTAPSPPKPGESRLQLVEGSNSEPSETVTPNNSEPSNRKLNINTASAAELEQLPGVGPVMAQRIIETRQSLPGGTFLSLEDLTAIRGIKGKTLARFRPYLEPEGL